jgi:hypothetical protein
MAIERRRRIAALAIALLVAGAARAAAPPPPPPPPAPVPAPVPIPWDEIEDAEQRLVERLHATPHWPFRVIAVMRLERYDGVRVDELLRDRLADDAWQVRAFALRAAARRGVDVPAGAFDREEDPRVIRAALRAGVTIDVKRIQRGARVLMRSREMDDVIQGLELAALSGDPKLQADATRRFRLMVEKLDEATLVRIGPRLARLVGATPLPRDAAAWQGWWQRGGSAFAFEDSGAALPAYTDDPLPIVASLDVAPFSAFIEYLDGLRGRDLDVAIVMDATASMRPMINEARAGIEQLILFFNDLSRLFRLAVIAYRDDDNPPIWEGQPLGTDIRALREFLFEIEITGGADLPEAVLSGLTACGDLRWNEQATRQIILIGDARPHDGDMYKIGDLLDELINDEIVVHTVHVPMEMAEQYRRTWPPEQVAAYEQEIARHNVMTKGVFGQMADRGGGDAVALAGAQELVPAIMHLTIAEAWWDAFDEFYAIYLDVCR